MDVRKLQYSAMMNLSRVIYLLGTDLDRVICFLAYTAAKIEIVV